MILDRLKRIEKNFRMGAIDEGERSMQLIDALYGYDNVVRTPEQAEAESERLLNGNSQQKTEQTKS